MFTAFSYEIVFGGEFRKNPYIDESGKKIIEVTDTLDPDDGIIQLLMIERINAENAEVHIFVDKDWKDYFGSKARIVWGKEFQNQKALDYNEVSQGVYHYSFIYNPFNNQAGSAKVSTYTPSPQKYSTYIKHYRAYCYSNSVYWFDSNQNVTDIFQNCSDENACTLDACSDNVCKNVLTCDGSTCAKNSQDYAKYCAPVPVVTEPVNQSAQTNHETETVVEENPKVKDNFAAAAGSSGIGGVFAKWWVWMTLGIILIGLFIVIFRRLSSEI